MFYVLVGNDLMAAVLVEGYKVMTLIKDDIDNILKDTNQTVASPMSCHRLSLKCAAHQIILANTAFVFLNVSIV